MPLVTIDPADARDHDDAVCAEPDDDPANPGGYIVCRRHRRRRPLRAPRLGAGPRGAASAAIRSISPTASCRCCPSGCRAICARCSEGVDRAVPGRAHGDRRRRQQAPHTLRARPDALGRQADLRAGAGRHRRPARRDDCAPLLDRVCGRSTRAYRALAEARDERASRSTSTCPNARSCSTPTARSPRVAFRERLDAHG